MLRQQADYIASQGEGSDSSEFNIFGANDFQGLQKLMVFAGQEFVDEIRKNLEKAKAIGTGKLADASFRMPYEKGSAWVLEVGYENDSPQLKYYDYVNKGVKGLGGKNAKMKTASGIYKFKSKRVNRKMATSILRWLRSSIKSITADKVDLSGVQKKRRKLKAIVDANESKKKLAYAISSAIKRDGLRATYYWDRATDKVFGQDFYEAAQKVIGSDLILIIKQYGNNNS